MVKRCAIQLLLVVCSLTAQQPSAEIDSRLEAAIHTEMVEGDLKRAIDQYRSILTQAGSNRRIAARALFQIAECQEKLAANDAARATYTRLVTEFADQPDIVARVKERLASRTKAQRGPRNLDFERVETGTMRGQSFSGWAAAAGSRIESRHQGCRSNIGCAVIVGPGRLMQSFSAAGYRGKTVRLRAWVRVESTGANDLAKLWLGVDRANGVRTIVDDMDDRPLHSLQWTLCDIAGEIDADGQSIDFGVLSSAKGLVWIDSVSFQIVPEAEIGADRAAIQKLYGRFDTAYLQGDFNGIAQLAASGARYYTAREPNKKETLAKAMDEWKAAAANGTELAHRTALTAIKLVGDGALVNAREEYIRSEANRTRSAAYVATRLDTWVRDGVTWKLKEFRVLTTRQIDSTTDAQTARRAAADLKRTAAPLATIEVGHTFYDLAPFGTAVGDARIVALGEATYGTREFFQIKHRLFEYLVLEKGFTVFAINANWPEAVSLDLYIKSGEGDPKALLTGMLWPWNTEEALDVVKWMREFNQAPGPHPTLTFASFGVAAASVVIPRVVDYLKRCAPLDAVTAQSNYAVLLDMESRLGEVYDDAATRASERAEAVVNLLDGKRELLIQASSSSAWRDARQAAEMARQAAAMRISGKGSAYGNEMMARNIEWLANDAYPGEKIVLWGHNSLVGFTPGEPVKSVGTWLREEFGDRIYVTGFTFHRGELLAIGVQNGMSAGVATQRIPESAETNGDSVFSAGGMPVFFLDLRTVSPAGALGRWLAEPHSFLEVGALWNQDDPQSNARVKTISKSYDGLIFLEEGHAARGL